MIGGIVSLFVRSRQKRGETIASRCLCWGRLLWAWPRAARPLPRAPRALTSPAPPHTATITQVSAELRQDERHRRRRPRTPACHFGALTGGFSPRTLSIASEFDAAAERRPLPQVPTPTPPNRYIKAVGAAALARDAFSLPAIRGRLAPECGRDTARANAPGSPVSRQPPGIYPPGPAHTCRRLQPPNRRRRNSPLPLCVMITRALRPPPRPAPRAAQPPRSRSMFPSTPPPPQHARRVSTRKRIIERLRTVAAAQRPYLPRCSTQPERRNVRCVRPMAGRIRSAATRWPAASARPPCREHVSPTSRRRRDRVVRAAHQASGACFASSTRRDVQASTILVQTTSRQQLDD